MGKQDAGEGFKLVEEEILQINSPQGKKKGQNKIEIEKVLHIDNKLRYVVILCKWNDKKALGMRWFWGKRGFPISRKYGTWLIIPEDLQNSLLQGIGENKMKEAKTFLEEN